LASQNPNKKLFPGASKLPVETLTLTHFQINIDIIFYISQFTTPSHMKFEKEIDFKQKIQEKDSDGKC
jgi:hypothetical protein